MKFIELYDNYDYLFSVAVPIIAWIIGFLCHRLSDKIRANKLKRILHTSKGKYELVLPVRKGFLDTDKSSTPLKWDYVTFEESLVIHEIRSMLDEIDIGADDFTLSKDDDSISVHNNVFCIGGPMVNSYVRSVFLKHLKNVKFNWNIEDTNQANYQIFKDFLFLDNTRGTGVVKVESEEITYNDQNEGYVIFARLVGKKDFSNGEHGTVHIVFGNNAKTTLSAVRSFSLNRKEMFKRLKKRKGHYFVIAKCNSRGEIEFDSFADLTDKAFS